MASVEELQAERRRRGYWIRRARERKGMTLDGLAELMGYAAKSGSTVSLWETGQRPVPSDRMGPLAAVLQLPAHWLVNPPPTDDERLEAAVRDATELERLDSEREADRDRRAAGGPDAELRRRSA